MNTAGTLKTNQRGFTLLELLVATAVFAVLSGLAWQGLQVVMEGRDRVALQSERLGRMQMMFTIMERDVEQLVMRPVRDSYAVTLDALQGSNDAMALTRAGWRNPAGHVRSELQRVGYRLADNSLWRDSWRVLDRAQDSEPAQAEMLADVDSLAIRYLDVSGAWHRQWPVNGFDAEKHAPLPKAVEVTLELSDWGVFIRLFQVAGPMAPPAKKAGTP